MAFHSGVGTTPGATTSPSIPGALPPPVRESDPIQPRSVPKVALFCPLSDLSFPGNRSRPSEVALYGTSDGPQQSDGSLAPSTPAATIPVAVLAIGSVILKPVMDAFDDVVFSMTSTRTRPW